MGLPTFRFTLSHAALGSIQISEPDGWKDAKLKLERHEEFHSLIEYFEGSFIFYGEDNIHNGGADFIRQVENLYGLDAELRITIEATFDDVNYQTIFDGQLDLTQLKEVKDNKIEVPIIRNDMWSKFISRKDTPVNLRSTTDLDGNAVPAVELVDMNLTSQALDQKYEGHGDQEATLIYDIPDNQYGGIDFATEVILEIEEKFTVARLESTTRPFPLFTVEYGGNYDFDIEIRTSTAVLFGSATDSRLEVRLQINEDTPIVLTQTGESFGLESWVNHHYLNTLPLKKNDSIRLYFFNNNAPGTSYQFIWFANILQDSHLVLTAHTVFPSTEGQAYLIHDAFQSIIERICGAGSF